MVSMGPSEAPRPSVRATESDIPWEVGIHIIVGPKKDLSQKILSPKKLIPKKIVVQKNVWARLTKVDDSFQNTNFLVWIRILFKSVEIHFLQIYKYIYIFLLFIHLIARRLNNLFLLGQRTVKINNGKSPISKILNIYIFCLNLSCTGVGGKLSIYHSHMA